MSKSRTNLARLPSASFLVFVLACSSAPESAAPTQLLVHVDADAEVAARLLRVRAFLYATAETDPDKPSHQQAFTIAQDDPTAEQVKLPFSFGVVAGHDDKAVLVIAGYTALAANALPVIEHKQLVEFKPGKSVSVSLKLSEVCFNRGTQCRDLGSTCAVESNAKLQAGACAPLIERASDAGMDAGQDASVAADSDMDAGAAELKPLETCSFENECASGYPCVESMSFGYSCLV